MIHDIHVQHDIFICSVIIIVINLQSKAVQTSNDQAMNCSPQFPSSCEVVNLLASTWPPHRKNGATMHRFLRPGAVREKQVQQEQCFKNTSGPQNPKSSFVFFLSTSGLQNPLEKKVERTMGHGLSRQPKETCVPKFLHSGRAKTLQHQRSKF